ncbi:M56 family metallopeptidase [Microbulbifer sp. 2304DJ12-6]|uniref:M56 family metallopeptidase n=1 Tax=Microbulbifer sp. 2304DJ12-6 TaxID=3233340 RepID=UPI0039B0A83A
MTIDLLAFDGLALLLQMVAGSTGAILIVMAFRKKLRTLFGARVAYAFWTIVPIAMFACLIPAGIQIEVPTALNLVPSTEIKQAANETLVTPVQDKQAFPTTIKGFTVEAGSSIPAFLTSLILPMWILGFAFNAGVLVYRHFRYVKDNKLSRKGDGDVFVAEHEYVGPAVIGFFTPRIIVPSNFDQRYSALEQQLILAHEQSHIQAGDMRINAFALMLKSLNWFNPFAHIAFALMRVDQELACDERVMRRHGRHRQTYAETLLKSQLMSQSAPLGCTWMLHSIHPLKQRIASLAGREMSATRRTLGVIAVIAVAATSGTVAWASLSSHVVTIDREDSEVVEQNQNVIASLPEEEKGRALVNAILRRQDDVAHTYIKAGTDVNYVLRGDGTPLVAAAYRNNVTIAKALLDAGADVNKPVRGVRNPLIIAAQKNDLAMVNLLVRHGANINSYVRGDGSPLVVAARRGHTQLARYLINHGANVNQPAPGDGNPLIMAARNGDLTMVRMLVEAGAEVDGFVLGDETPLIGAARNGKLAVAQYLIDRGADVNLKVKTDNPEPLAQYRSPLGQAELKGGRAMVALLKKNGAKSILDHED